MSKRAEFEKDWKKYLAATDPRELERRARFYFRRANRRIGIAFVRIARDFIKQRKYAVNAPLTVALKGKSLPLADSGQLMAALTFDLRGPFGVALGVGRSPMAGRRLLYEVLHDGARIRVTPQMIGAVLKKISDQLSAGKFKGRSQTQRRQHKSALESTQRKLQQVSGKVTGASFWIIPPRPFLEEPLSSKEFIEIVVGEWAGALYMTIMLPVEEFQAEQRAKRAAAKAARTKRPRPRAKPKRRP